MSVCPWLGFGEFAALAGRWISTAGAALSAVGGGMAAAGAAAAGAGGWVEAGGLNAYAGWLGGWVEGGGISGGRVGVESEEMRAGSVGLDGVGMSPAEETAPTGGYVSSLGSTVEWGAGAAAAAGIVA